MKASRKKETQSPIMPMLRKKRRKSTKIVMLRTQRMKRNGKIKKVVIAAVVEVSRKTLSIQRLKNKMMIWTLE